MTLRKLSYQHRVLDSLDAYLNALSRQQIKAAKIKAANQKESDPDLQRPEVNVPEAAWEDIKDTLPRRNVPFSPRIDGTGRPVPNIVYNIPTGGGKTYMAISSISKIFSKYLNSQNGFVLWIVPNEAIYTQTMKQLIDKEHPYRQLLSNLAGAPKDVKLMSKTTPFSAQDVQQNLCIMILMLQSSNRQNKSTLRIFRERGDVEGFVPPEDDLQAHIQIKKDIPNLDICDLANSPTPWLPVKESLGNALRITRPIVILDEGHKAVSDLAFKTLYDFNPSFVLELTATPKDVPKDNRYQNILARVSGTDLDREGMLKLPINLDSQQQSKDWESTLKSGLRLLDNLAEKAQKFHADNNRYIRPIMLVQVERTGRDQRDGMHIHAEDVREWLIKHGGMREHEIAIKTSQQNDLKQPENQDLLSEENTIRIIITKQALQEGWDCPFAYVLCSLVASQTTTAMTQILGRILRQPHAEKTGVPELDQCYVITHYAETGKVVRAIKKGLEHEGMQDLQDDIQTGSSNGKEYGTRLIPRRKKFQGLSIFLPKVLRTTEEGTRELDYETDVLYPLDWRGLDVSEFVKSIPDTYTVAERQLYRIAINSQEEKEQAAFLEARSFDAVRITRYICDIVQNPWVAYDIVESVRQGLKNRGFSDQKLGKFSSFVEEKLRDWLATQRDQKAEVRFANEVEKGRIQFRLRMDNLNWEMPNKIETSHPKGTQHLLHYDGAIQKSLFEPVFEPDFNEDEKNVALFLDKAQTMNWWHRNAARKHYHIQGWKREKIYPDFICSVRKRESNEKYVVLETKGDFLANNEDSEYKRKMLQLMKDSFSLEKSGTSIGKMEVLLENNICVECEMVLMSEYPTELPQILHQ